MTGVLSGFAVIVVVVSVGWCLARWDVLGREARLVINRLVFYVATPALLLDSLARTSLDTIFGGVFLVSACSALLVAALYLLLARFVLRRSGADLVVGAMAAGYVNSANLGIPIALYVLGDLGFVTPLLLFQVVILQPIVIAVLNHTERQDIAREEATNTQVQPATSAPSREKPSPEKPSRGILSRRSRTGALATLEQSLRSPLVAAALLGLALAALPWTPPDRLLEPVRLIGQISVPGALLIFGMSLYGVRILERGQSPRREIALASALKLVAHPLLAIALGAGLLGMRGHELFTVVIAAALPTAQNVLVVATRYGRGVLLARDTAVITTLGSLPVLLLVTAFLAG